MTKRAIAKIRVRLLGVDEFELPRMGPKALKTALCDRLGLEPQFTELIFKKSGREVIVDYIWARQQIMLGLDGQSKLRSGRCTIVGVGALGNELVRNLVLMGVGNITLIDHDRIESSNLNRTMFTRSDIGKNKAEALAGIMNRHYPYAKLRAIPKRFERVPERILNSTDVLIGGLDNMASRLYLADFAIKHGIPLIDGGLKGLQARVQVWTVGRGCIGCDIPPENYAEILDLHDSCEMVQDTKIPSFPTISSITAAVCAGEAMKILLGNEPMNGVLIIDLMKPSFCIMPLKRNPDCIVCKGK